MNWLDLLELAWLLAFVAWIIREHRRMRRLRRELEKRRDATLGRWS